MVHNARSSRAYDIIVYGATGFVGEILSTYLLEMYGPGGTSRRKVTWALAARSQSKLEALRAKLGPKAADIPLIVAEAQDFDSLKTMCRQACVVITTVGPYDLYGEPLVKACVETGTDYCDLTGEPQFMHRMIERYAGEALQSGARIVHTCGFDSIPSDLGNLFLQDHLQQETGHPAFRVRMRVRGMKGGFSGGTYASMVNAIKVASSDPAMRKIMGNPYALCPPVDAPRPRQPDVMLPSHDPAFGAWVGPFIMATVNTRVVHRTNALSGLYGPDFQYDEAVLMGGGLQGAARSALFTAGLGGFATAASFSLTRWALDTFVMPAPGQGPSPEEQLNGLFDMRFHGRTREGYEAIIKVTGDRDPGYGSTAKMLGQAALFLAKLPKSKLTGGFWTPATAFGLDIVPALVKDAGLTFEVISAAHQQA